MWESDDMFYSETKQRQWYLKVGEMEIQNYFTNLTTALSSEEEPQCIKEVLAVDLLKRRSRFDIFDLTSLSA